MIEIERKRDEQKAEIAELTSQKKKLKNKIEVLASIHAKRDVQVRQDLAREQEIRANIEGDIKNFDDRQQFLNDEINSYKKIHDDLQVRYSAAQKERQQEKNVSFLFYFQSC